jgi:hypothetical protein
MSRHIREQSLLALLQGDEGLYRLLRSSGLVPDDVQALSSEHLELARVVHTLVHELDVNWEGVEVILHLREQLVSTQNQVAELLLLLRARHRA